MKVYAMAWVWEYSGNDCAWHVFRTTKVTYKKRRTYDHH